MVTATVPVSVGTHIDIPDMLNPHFGKEAVIKMKWRRLLPHVEVRRPRLLTGLLVEMAMVRARRSECPQQVKQLPPVVPPERRVRVKVTEDDCWAFTNPTRVTAESLMGLPVRRLRRFRLPRPDAHDVEGQRAAMGFVSTKEIH